MSKRPIDKTKKSNIKCEHCMFFIQDKNANMVRNNNECTNADSPKYGKSGLHYWNRCKQFEWAESKEQTE